MSTWSFSYYFEVEDAGESDPSSVEIEITPEEASAIEKAQSEGVRLAPLYALQKLQMRAYNQIREMLTGELVKIKDDYTLSCLAAGANPFDYAYTLHADIFEPSDAEY